MHLGEEIERAAARIGPFVRETLLEPSSWLSEAGGADVHLKLENLQVTGSFKARGAMNKVLLLDDSARSRGVVTASTGNHGAAVAFSLRRTGTTGLVFVPENAARTKVAAIQRLGAEVRFHGTDGAETESFARRYAEQAGATFISPYNDAQVIAGQGTIGMEIARRLEGVDAVFASLGGGGSLAALPAIWIPRRRVRACMPARRRTRR